MEDYIPEIWRRAIERQVDALRDRVEELEMKLGIAEARIRTIDDNTREAVTILRDWKGAMAVLKFTAKVIAPLGAIAAAITAVVGLIQLFWG